MFLKSADRCWNRVTRALGFVLAFAALTAFVLHPNHLRPEADSQTASHCTVCHTAPMGASAPQSVQVPTLFVAYTVTPSIPVRPFSVCLSAESPRGPPAA